MEKSPFTTEYRALCRLLRSVREQQEVTQTELAKRLDETQSYISKCERGERRLDLVQLQTFCRALDISLVEFVKEFERLVSKTHRRGR